MINILKLTKDTGIFCIKKASHGTRPSIKVLAFICDITTTVLALGIGLLVLSFPLWILLLIFGGLGNYDRLFFHCLFYDFIIIGILVIVNLSSRYYISVSMRNECNIIRKKERLLCGFFIFFSVIVLTISEISVSLDIRLGLYFAPSIDYELHLPFLINLAESTIDQRYSPEYLKAHFVDEQGTMDLSTVSYHEMQHYPFYYYDNIHQIILPKNSTINECGLGIFPELTEVTFPENLKCIENFVFLSCPKLKKMHYKGKTYTTISDLVNALNDAGVRTCDGFKIDCDNIVADYYQDHEQDNKTESLETDKTMEQEIEPEEQVIYAQIVENQEIEQLTELEKLKEAYYNNKIKEAIYSKYVNDDVLDLSSILHYKDLIFI